MLLGFGFCLVVEFARLGCWFWLGIAGLCIAVGVLAVVVCVLRCGFPVSWVGSVPLMVWFSGFLDFDVWFTVALLLCCGWLVC